MVVVVVGVSWGFKFCSDFVCGYFLQVVLYLLFCYSSSFVYHGWSVVFLLCWGKNSLNEGQFFAGGLLNYIHQTFGYFLLYRVMHFCKQLISISLNTAWSYNCPTTGTKFFGDHDSPTLGAKLQGGLAEPYVTSGNFHFCQNILYQKQFIYLHSWSDSSS